MEANKPVFNPEAQYAWKPDDMFPLSGAGLQILYNGLTEKLSTPESQEVLKAYSMFQVVQGILASQVEQGNIISKQEFEKTIKK